jgi:hypothetical protein
MFRLKINYLSYKSGGLMLENQDLGWNTKDSPKKNKVSHQGLEATPHYHVNT